MKLPKPKPVNYDLIPDDNAAYGLLNKARQQWHEEMYGAKIALAYRKRLKSDKDGHLILGRCVKVSDLQKEFSPFDFIIVLNKEVWQDTGFDEKKKMALLDHELCHAALLKKRNTPALLQEMEKAGVTEPVVIAATESSSEEVARTRESRKDKNA